ncbi:hypothetical protein DPMN_175447 [Dreissena polymorpha]|uniref:Uncharacterized protein n=1 Tax=Dreissena polymorpha TaxID=45954 RepID=A0A9D4E6I3_DREPO|nr:hypothetical protein DPMN_175447 [Dreissena polymorpha]
MIQLAKLQQTCLLSNVTKYLHTSSAVVHRQTWTVSHRCVPSQTRGVWKISPWCVPSQTRGVTFKTGLESSFKSQHKRDGVSKDFVLVFSKTNQNYYTIGIPCVWILGGVFLAGAGYAIQNILDTDPIQRESVSINNSGPIDPLETICVFSVFTLTFLVGLAKISKSMVLRMYYKEDINKFIAVVLRYGIFRRKINFSPAEIKHKKLQKFSGIYEVKGQQFNALQNEFLNVRYFNIFTGVIVQDQSHYRNTSGNKVMKS